MELIPKSRKTKGICNGVSFVTCMTLYNVEVSVVKKHYVCTRRTNTVHEYRSILWILVMVVESENHRRRNIKKWKLNSMSMATPKPQKCRKFLMLKIAFFNFLLLMLKLIFFLDMKHDFNLLNTRLWLREDYNRIGWCHCRLLLFWLWFPHPLNVMSVNNLIAIIVSLKIMSVFQFFLLFFWLYKKKWEIKFE